MTGRPMDLRAIEEQSDYALSNVSDPSDVADCARQVPALVEALRGTLEILRAVESGAIDNSNTACCPLCGGGEPYTDTKHERPTHFPGCKLAEALGDAAISERCRIDGCWRLVEHRADHERLNALTQQRANLAEEIRELERR